MPWSPCDQSASETTQQPTKTRRKQLDNQPKRVENDSTTNQNALKTTRQPKRIGNDSTITERRRAACISQAKRLKQHKKGILGYENHPTRIYLPRTQARNRFY